MADLPAFDATLLYSVPLPFEGHYGQIVAVYDAGRVLNYHRTYEALTADLRAELSAAQAAVAALVPPEPQEGEESEDLPLPPDPAVLDAAQDRVYAAARAVRLAVIGHVVHHFTWPFAGAAPAPTDPAAFDTWAGRVLEWLSGPGLEAVIAGLRAPKSETVSPAP